MATSTTNLGLRKPAKSDYVNVVTDINENMDILDGAIGAVPSGSNVQSEIAEVAGIAGGKASPDSIAIVADGDTHIAISSGEYVYVKNHGTLDEGLYKASSAIAANASLSLSNLTAVSKGLANVISNMFKTVTYSKTISVAASSYLAVSANDLQVSTPAGYEPVAIVNVLTGYNNLVIYGLDATATGTDGVVRVRNVTSSASNDRDLSVTILYVRTGI